MNIEKLRKQVEAGSSIAALASHFGLAKTTIRYWLKKSGLKTSREPSNLNHRDSKHCLVCAKQSTKKWLCPGCYTKVRRYRQKKRAVEMLGGKCCRCGWFGNIAGFEFHHVDGRTKETTIGNVANKSWEVVKNELKKCILLCATCHRIEHSNNEGEAFLVAVDKYQGAGLE